jgi:hypothetical protein
LVSGGNVAINVDVEIIGERQAAHMTTISGGYVPIQSSAQVKTRIVGIDFESPLFEAINLTASAGTEIIGNRVHAPVPVVAVCTPCGFSVTNVDGIDVGSFGAAQTVTGKIRISGNQIEDVVAGSSNTLGLVALGIQADSAAADYEITDNTLRNIGSVGIVVIRVKNSVHIADNWIEMAGEEAGVSGGYYIAGIEVVGNSAPEIAHNRVIANSPGVDGVDVAGGPAWGDDVGTVGALVHHNHVTVHSTFVGSGAVNLYDLVTNSVVKDNVVDGNGPYALQVSTGGPPTDTASGNRLIDNEIHDFNAAVADVFLDANSANNVVIGECKSPLDLGVGNSVQCGTEVAHRAGSFTASAARSATPSAAVRSTQQSLLRNGPLSAHRAR